MRRLGSVQQKMQCVFVIDVKEDTSRKREGQVSPAANTAAFDFEPRRHKFNEDNHDPNINFADVFMH